MTPGPRAVICLCDLDPCAKADLAFLELLLTAAAFASRAPVFRDVCVGNVRGELADGGGGENAVGEALRVFEVEGE